MPAWWITWQHKNCFVAANTSSSWIITWRLSDISRKQSTVRRVASRFSFVRENGEFILILCPSHDSALRLCPCGWIYVMCASHGHMIVVQDAVMTPEIRELRWTAAERWTELVSRMNFESSRWIFNQWNVFLDQVLSENITAMERNQLKFLWFELLDFSVKN